MKNNTTVPALPTRFKKSILAALQVVLGVGFFVALNWPLGLQSSMVLLTTIVFVGALIPVALAARTVFKSIAAALPLAAVFHFLLMPRVDSFAELAPCLFVFFFPFLYGVASRNPSTKLASIASVIVAKALISVSTTPPSYDLVSFANTYLGMAGGCTVVLILAYLFETMSPRRSFHKLLMASLLTAAKYLRTLEEQSFSISERTELAATNRRELLHKLGQLKQLSAIVDYGQDPTITSSEIASVLRAVETLVLRLVGLEPRHRSSESMVPSEKRQIVWCADSLMQIGQRLESKIPLAAASDPTTAALSGEGLSSTPLAAQLRSIVQAISECEIKLESIDWKRWCWNYF